MSTLSKLAPLALYPAIDLAGGRCVRLLRGDFGAETVYGDAVEQAKAYAAAGAGVLHIVDLDAARTGEPRNRALVLDIVAAVDIPVQLGGGIRDEAAASAALDAGVDRVVLGTAAVERPALLRGLAARHPRRIVLGLDHRRSGRPGEDSGPAGPAGSAPVGSGRTVALRGWQQDSGRDLLEVLAEVSDVPLAAVVITDISTDGTLAGPDLEGYRLALGASALPLVASGGVGRAEDLAALAALEVAGRRLAGVVVGRALLSGALRFEEAVAACAR